MAETNVNVTAGSGTGIDTFNVGAGAVGSGTEAMRQVVVIGDPTTKANVQTVNAAGAALVVAPKDTGRSQVMLSWERLAGGTAESALVNFTNGTKAATALTAASSYTVTTGKTLRIQAINITLRDTATTLFSSRVRIRQAPSAIANTSPIIWNAEITHPTNTAAVEEGTQVDFLVPDGIEVASGQQITVTHLESTATGTVTVVLIGYEY